MDACLADDCIFEPYQQCFRTLIGRPTVPVETYLRLMYLKHRYRLGYELLVQEVTDSLHWRRFCHLGWPPRSRTRPFVSSKKRALHASVWARP